MVTYMDAGRLVLSNIGAILLSLESLTADAIQDFGTKQILQYDFMVESWDCTRRL